jgi:flagellar motor protein MotB
MAEHKEKDGGHGGGKGDGHGGGKGDGHGDGHGGKKKHKKHHGGHGGGHEEGHEGAPEWLISFADMVMLMMGFFVIMFAMNAQPKGGNAGGGGEQSEGVAPQPDMIDFAIAVRKAFHNDVDVTSSDPRDQLLIQRILQSQHGGAGESKDEGTKGKDQNVQSVRKSDHFGRGTSVMFPARSASISESAGKTLAEISKQLRGQATVIEVRGHVGASEAYGDPEAAMTLGADRALAAARRLAAGGIDWSRLRVISAGSGERVEPFPETAAEDAKNARVEIRVLDEVAQPREPAKQPAESGVAGTGTLGANATRRGGVDLVRDGDKNNGKAAAAGVEGEKAGDKPAEQPGQRPASDSQTGPGGGSGKDAPASGNSPGAGAPSGGSPAPGGARSDTRRPAQTGSERSGAGSQTQRAP